MLYEFEKDYTRQDMIEELEAYIKCENEVFDFGEGEMKMETFEETSYGFELSLLDGSFLYDSAWYLHLKLPKDEDEVSDTKHHIKFNRYYINHVRQKQRNMKLYDDTKKSYPQPYYIDLHDESSYLKRYYRGKRSMYLKRQSNKKIRRNKEYFPKGNKVKRLFDFWWELY